MFRRLEPRIGRFFGSTLTDVASDSWEYARSRHGGRYWSPALLQTVEGVAEQDLRPCLHALLGYGPHQKAVLADLAEVEQRAIHHNFFVTIREFLRARRLRHRPQAYGRGLERDLFTAYALADIPEIEEGVYVPEAVWSARVLGKLIISCEAFTHVSIRHGNLRYDAHRGRFTAKTDPQQMWKTTPRTAQGTEQCPFRTWYQSHADTQLQLLATRNSRAGLADVCRDSPESQHPLVAGTETAEHVDGS